MRQTRWLPAALWPVGVTAVVIGFILLFRGDGEVTAIAVVNRAVGGSFIFSGLIAWQRRPGNRSGPLMTVTGFLFLAEPLLAEIDHSVAYSLSELEANWWTVPFATLVLGFPTGRLESRLDRAIVWSFVASSCVGQLVWLFFQPFSPGYDNVFLLEADQGVADVIDRVQSVFGATGAVAVAAVGCTRWWRAAPPLRRLLLPTLAGAVGIGIIGVQVYYQTFANEFIRASQEITSLVLVLVPLAFLFGLLQAQFARAGMAELVMALQQAPDATRLGALLSKTLRDPSLELVYWVPKFECYANADGRRVELPAAGSGRVATRIDAGRRVAALIHDAALTYEPHLLEVVCAAANVALERERLHAELQSRIEELAGSRARVVEAGDEARRRIERDLHDGAQQRLVSLSIQLRMTEDRVKTDPDTALKFVAAAREEVSKSIEELRELARGIHPAVLEYGLDTALGTLAERSPVPVELSVELPDRLPDAVELAAYFVACEALANVGKYAQASRVLIRVRRLEDLAVIEIADDGIGGADDALGSGLRGLADRVEALGGRLRILSPAGGGTTLTAEMPCAIRPAAR